MNIETNPLTLAVLAASALALSACSSSTYAAPRAVSTAAPLDVAGDYHGAMTDTAGATVTIEESTLSQHGSILGGALMLEENGAAGPTVPAAVSWTIASSAVSGSAALDLNDGAGPRCVFTVSGTYTVSATAPNTFSGTYDASGCASGASWPGTGGTFTLTQDCTDLAASFKRGPKGGAAPC